MNYYLYVLKSLEYSRHYIGISADIENRLFKHNKGEVRSTKAYLPWKCVHLENFSDKKSARMREIFLKKNAKARKELFEKLIAPIV